MTSSGYLLHDHVVKGAATGWLLSVTSKDRNHRIDPFCGSLPRADGSDVSRAVSKPAGAADCTTRWHVGEGSKKQKTIKDIRQKQINQTISERQDSCL